MKQQPLGRKKMKKLLTILAVFALVFAYSNINAQTENPTTPTPHGKNFVDKNGDGYNDNAPDHDGDGIPNGVDPDYKGAKVQKNKFVDLDGDGINDNAGKGKRNGKGGKGGYGSGSGAGQGQSMQKGKANATGDCTETGTGTQTGQGRGFKGGRK